MNTKSQFSFFSSDLYVYQVNVQMFEEPIKVQLLLYSSEIKMLEVFVLLLQNTEICDGNFRLFVTEESFH